MNQSDIFRVFMNYIWGDANTAEYNRYHDANEVAKALGAVIVNGKPYTSHATGEVDTWHVWSFPDKSQVEILADGGGIDDSPGPMGVYDDYSKVTA